MYEKVETYIYKVGEDNYRIKIQKKDRETGLVLKVSENHKLPLDKVINIRNQHIAKFEERIKLKTMDFENKKEEISQTSSKSTMKQTKKKSEKEKKIDKYIYQLGPSKFKVKIKKGTKGEPGYFNFSRVIYGTISVARKLRDKKLAENKLEETVSNDKGKITLNEFSKLFLEMHCKPHSVTTYDGAVNKLNNDILPALGNYKLEKLNVLILKKFINDLMKRKKKIKGKEKETISSTTANDVYRLLRNMLNRAVDWGYIKENPLLKVEAPPVSKTEKETFNKEEMEEVFELLKNESIEIKCMCVIVLFTGFRRGELLGLHLDDIKYGESSLHVARDVVRDRTNQIVVENPKPKTEKSIRDVPVPDFCLEIIEEYLEWRSRKIEGLKIKNPNYKEIDNLFLSEDGNLMRPEYPSKKWSEFVEKHKLKHVTLHGLRHSYCTLQMNENTDLGPNDVAKLMGHSQLSTTFHYSHQNTDKREEAVSIFDDFSRGKSFNLNQVLSICMGRKYASTKDITSILNYLMPHNELELVQKMNYCKNEILKKYPRLKSINDSGVNVDNIFDWLEEQQENFGNKFTLSPINTLSLELDSKGDLYEKNSTKVL